MNLLLDTHVFVWWRQNHRRLSEKSRQTIARAGRVYVSAIAAWEIEIKSKLGKIEITGTVSQGIEASGFEFLPLTLHHTEIFRSVADHHTDPFDKMLVAQALAEDLTLVTADAKLEPYGCRFLWV